MAAEAKRERGEAQPPPWAMESLGLEQISACCGLSPKAVDAWVARGDLEAFRDGAGGLCVRTDGLVDFLVRHNMPIPDGILPHSVKKVLFVFAENLIADEIVLRFLMRYFQWLRQRSGLVIDYSPYGAVLRMKLLVYRPDLVILDVASTGETCELCHLIKSSVEFEGIKVAAIVEASRVSERLRNELEVDALLPRCADAATLLGSIRALFED